MAKYSRKAWLASIYYSSKKSSTKSFFVSISCQLSSVQSCTRKPIRDSPRGKTNEDQPKKKKTKPYMQSELKSQNCGISYITRYVHHCNTKKKRSVLSISSPLISVSQFRAVALLNQWRELHVCHVHVHHQLGNVVNGERYAAIRNAVLMRIDVSSGN